MRQRFFWKNQNNTEKFAKYIAIYRKLCYDTPDETKNDKLWRVSDLSAEGVTQCAAGKWQLSISQAKGQG